MLRKIPGFIKSIGKGPHPFARILTAAQFFLWSVLIRAIQPLFSVRRITALVSPKGRRSSLHPDWIYQLVGQFDRNHLFGEDSNCLVRSLLLYRFLKQGGQDVDLVIGFKGAQGHAWIEHNGVALMEAANPDIAYTRILKFDPAARRLVPSS